MDRAGGVLEPVRDLSDGACAERLVAPAKLVGGCSDSGDEVVDTGSNAFLAGLGALAGASPHLVADIAGLPARPVGSVVRRAARLFSLSVRTFAQPFVVGPRPAIATAWGAWISDV